MNHTVMMGRLVRDPQINYVQNSEGDEVAVANFRLAVDRKFSDETDFFPCSAFGWQSLQNNICSRASRLL